MPKDFVQTMTKNRWQTARSTVKGMIWEIWVLKPGQGLNRNLKSGMFGRQEPFLKAESTLSRHLPMPNISNLGKGFAQNIKKSIFTKDIP